MFEQYPDSIKKDIPREFALNHLVGSFAEAVKWWIGEKMKMIRPALWLLERYNQPYYLVFTNFPGEIVYEDEYQVAALTDGEIKIADVQESWSPED